MTSISSVVPSFPWLDPKPANANPPASLESPGSAETKEDDEKLREVFNQFVGETFYGQLLSTMRKSVDKSAYFHGGRGEEVFQGQLDQLLTERMSQANANNFSDSMFELFQLQRHPS